MHSLSTHTAVVEHQGRRWSGHGRRRRRRRRRRGRVMVMVALSERDEDRDAKSRHDHSQHANTKPHAHGLAAPALILVRLLVHSQGSRTHRDANVPVTSWPNNPPRQRKNKKTGASQAYATERVCAHRPSLFLFLLPSTPSLQSLVITDDFLL